MLPIDNSRGQTLIEMVVVIAVGIIVVAALVFATISSLRNSSVSKNQAIATKLAQEGLERVRAARDRGSQISYVTTSGSNATTSWDSNSTLWSTPVVSLLCSVAPCYFKLSNTRNDLVVIAGGGALPIDSGEKLNQDQFSRIIILSDDSSSSGQEKTVTCIVTWSDFSGSHESRMTTYLRRLQ